MKKIKEKRRTNRRQDQAGLETQKDKQARETQAESLKERALGWWRFIRRWGGRAAKIFAAISAVGSLIILITPKLTIQPTVVADPELTLGTLFAVSNTGHAPVFDVQFGCAVVGSQGNFHFDVKATGAGGLDEVHAFWPGQTATRTCANVVFGLQGDAKVDVFAKYRWPVWFFHSTTTAHFVAKRGSAGYFLVPDIRR